jgi:hypothetical protein
LLSPSLIRVFAQQAAVGRGNVAIAVADRRAAGVAVVRVP